MLGRLFQFLVIPGSAEYEKRTVKKNMEIAVIGSGVSGLVSAYLLSRNNRVTLYEADSRIGGHVNTVTVESESGPIKVDTGFIVFNRPNYPGFNRLINRLGVESQASRMSFSVKDERNGIEYSGSSLANLFAQRGSLNRGDHWRMLIDIQKFILMVKRLSFAESSITVEECIKQHAFSNEFLDRFLSPLGCALWSCPHDKFLSFPIRFVAEFLENHQLINLTGRPEWRTIQGGSNQYVNALIGKLNAEILLDSGVEQIQRGSSQILVSSKSKSKAYDEVVVAAHADQAIGLLLNPTQTECDILSSFEYQKNEAILHTDTSVLPEKRSAWSSWNYRVPKDFTDVATVTYNMNLLQSLESITTYCVSLNESQQIEPGNVIARINYDHPIASIRGLAAQSRRAELVRHEGISYCGAYWGNGFHEAGVQSALQVANAYGEEL
ncbi:MAG: FAD-dependent oxidoreductase [Fimbriimonadaceae bacterium]|nr:FAD-dependent oxidoreductase [Fimbriimonadaceae bacterium]